MEVRALVNLLADRSWLVLKRYLDEIIRDEDRILSTSDSLEKILRAQGAKRVYTKLEDQIKRVVEDALLETKEEEKENA